METGEGEAKIILLQNKSSAHAVRCNNNYLSYSQSDENV